KGPWLGSTSPPFSINFTTHNERSGDSNLLMCGKAPPVKDQKMISTSDLKLEDNSEKSSSAIEVMMTTVCEKTKKLEKSIDDSSGETVKIVEGQILTDTIQ
ncbi:hypothetical protein N329_06693, partial [Haliaeetus albicilla]